MGVRIVKKPATGPPGAGLVWVGFGAGIVGGFVLGVLVGGSAGDSFLEAAIGSFTAAAATIGWLRLPRTTLAVGIPLRVALLLFSWMGALLIGFAARAGSELRSGAQLKAWFGPLEAQVGVALVLAGLVLAVMLSFRRPAVSAEEGGPR